jgi:phosphoserine phosphatase RsbU/P
MDGALRRRLPDGRVLIAVGDVMGKGVDAALHTSRITHTMRSLAMGGLELDLLLERLDEQITWQDPDLMATVWCGLYEPDSGELHFASLGHPPALLLRADGNPIRLELEGLPLGLRDLTDRPPEIRARRLAPRDLLVLYTDGVVEASKDYLAGQEALLAAVAFRRDEPVGEILNGALEELLANAGHSDDAAMLILRRG